jgi:hypothetical protein
MYPALLTRKSESMLQNDIWICLSTKCTVYRNPYRDKYVLITSSLREIFDYIILIHSSLNLVMSD